VARQRNKQAVAGLTLDGLDCVDCPPVDAGQVLARLVEMVTACTGPQCRPSGKMGQGSRGASSGSDGQQTQPSAS
jgi:hypothetical protein